MVDEWCGSEGALGVGLVLQNVATVAQDPEGELFEAVVDRLSACYAARTRRQKEISREQAEPVSPSRALVTMGGGNALNRAYECCRTYYTTSGPGATTGMHVHES